MSSSPPKSDFPKSEARRRPVSVLAVKLWETAETLEQGLDNPTEILEMLVSALAKGEDPTDVWTRLHEAAQRHDRLADLAFSYEHVVADKRVKLLPTPQQAHIFLRAAEFCADLFGDTDGAIKYAERATHAVPGHPQAFAMLERLLIAGEKTVRLAELYIEASTREEDVQRKLALLQRAAELLQDQPSADELAIDVGQRILKIIPGDEAAREALVRRLLARGRHKDVVDVFEQALRSDPAPSEGDAVMIRELLVDLCLNELKDPQRALAHIEGLLGLVPNHPQALKYAEALLDNRNLALRAAAALSDAYEKSGRIESAIGMLSFELKQVRGPRRVEVQRRLGILRQDALNDPAGALELLGPVVAGDPGNDDLRRRFVALSLSLNQFEQAARLLARAQQTSRDVGVRARVGVDVGHVYLKTGDLKRAQQAFQQALDAGHDDGAMLDAARHLCDLYAEGDLKQMLNVLEIIVRLEPEKEARQAAARRLARLSDNDPPDPARAIVAYKALIGSPWSDEALKRLETLYREAADEEGLADVLFHRAERTKDPAEARRLAFQAAELASARTRNPDAAIAAWQRLAERYGASREILERIVPLLEQAQRYPELAALLEQELATAEPTERVALLIRLAQLRQTRIGDVTGALQNFGEALALDPSEPTARAAVEKLLIPPETRELAAQILEPLYRNEEPGTGLIRVLEARAEVSTDPATRLAALAEAAELSAQSLNDPVRALDLAGRGLAEVVAAAPDQIQAWLERVQVFSLTAGDPARRVRLLSVALADRVVDSEPMLALARATGDALAAAGEITAAMDAFRRALAFEPSSRELMQRVDQVLAQQGEPEERLALYRAALEQEADVVRRRELLHAIATLQRRELKDLKGAIATWRAAVAADARDLGAREALVDALEEAGEFPELATELERALEFAEGERKNLALLRLAEVRSKLGDAARALVHYCELMENADLADDVLEVVEQLAREQNDGKTIQAVIQRRLQHTSDPVVRAALLERLGNALAWQLGDSMAAGQAWLEGAHLSEGAAQDPERARRLYERVLGAMPEHVEAAERAVELSVRAGDWEGAREPFEVLLRALDERDIVAILLGLEERALGAEGAQGYVQLVDLALAGEIQAFRARHVLLAKARALSQTPAGAEQASAIFRKLLEGAGDEAVPDADAFEAFLNHAELTPARIEDYRWLFRWRLDRTSDPASVLFAWAQAEEQTFGDARAAAQQYERVVSLDPERLDAISELARLRAADGDAAGALESFRALRDRCDPETRPAVDLKMAGLYVTLGQPADALELVTPLLARNASDVEALRVVYHALSAPDSRARAAAVLEQVAEASDDPAARADVIEALLKASAEAPELAEAHSRWLKQLLETKSEEPEEALRLSLRGAEAAPGEEELWNIAEQMARKLNQPAPVAEAYARTVERQLSPDIADGLGRRMVEFYEEWFDDAERVVQLLRRVLELCPSATWAFERLKLAFNASGRWEELFSLYNARLEAPLEASEQINLLREAAMAARDFAGDPERAIGYFERLNRLNPGDHRIESSLERLYERHARKRPLIELLTTRLEGMKEAERGELTGRIAALWLDLGEPAPAFDLAERLLKRPEETSGAVSLLERIVTMSESQAVAGEEGPSVRERAAAHLKAHYRATKSVVDVVRMLHVQAESAAPKQRVKLLEEIVSLSLEELNDELGAFETLAALILLEPDAPRHRKAFSGLAERLKAHDRRAETLVAITEHVAEPAVKAGLLSEAGDVYRELGTSDKALDLYRRVLGLGRDDKPVALHAARELSTMLRGSEHVAEHVGVLEQLAELEASQKAKRAALGEAAALALSALSDPERAIRAWRARLEIGKRDFEAVDGLCRALEAAQRWEELIEALEVHADLSEDEAAARADRVRIAEICAEILRAPERAIEAWEGVRRRHGRSLDSFDALHRLFTSQAAWPELARLLEEEVASEADVTRRFALHSEIGELHRQHTGDLTRAIEAFVAASSWDRAIEVAGKNHGDAAQGRQNCESLLALAVSVWGRGEGDVEAAAKAADWAIAELSDRLLEAGQYEAVVAQLLKGAELPFAVHRRRELRRDAACLCSDRLSDDARAIELFTGLLTEDPGDDVARASVTRLSLLLEEQGRHEEVVGLWEQQARARSDGGDSAGAAVLWARAGDLAEQRLGDLPRAIEAFTAGAKLRGEASLEALARIYKAQGEYARAASVLAVLCEQSSPEELAARALELADAYGAIDDLGRARSALEQAVGIAVEPSKLRARLAAIYRQVRDYAALAKLLSEEAGRAVDKKTQLSLLREAASLHSEERRDPASAVPLLERAIELDPDDQKQRLQLAQALYLAARYDDAAVALRDQIQRYGTRKPKDRALAHFQLARVLLSAGQQSQALVELDAASKIDPASPAIMQMFARVSFEQGDLDRAERMYRALLLVVGRDDAPDAPSKADALISLSEIASRRDDTGRAEEFIESAFESALESAREATALEAALRQRGRYSLLSRALETRLAQRLEPREAARALADLVALHADSLRDLDAVRPDLQARAERLERQIESGDAADDAAWSALGQVYDYLGDAGREAAILERRIAAAANRASRSPADADLFFRLARAKLQDPNAADQGLEFVERALDISGDFSRAQALLATVEVEETTGPRLSALYERVARAMGDGRALVSALSIQMGLPGLRAQTVREAVEAAKALGESDLMMRMLRTALENPDADFEPDEAAGLRLELAGRLELSGDVRGALDLREQAAPHLPRDEARILLLAVAQAAAADPADSARALRVYERLRRDEPANREFWQPLLSLHRAAGPSEEMLAVLEETIGLVDDRAERSQLRLEQVNIELGRPGREDAAIELLRQAIEDDPSQRDARRTLRELLVHKGRSNELVDLLRTELDQAKDAGDGPAIVTMSKELAVLLEAEGRVEEALDVCRSGLEWDGAPPELLETMARLAEATGDPLTISDALEALLRVERGEKAAALGHRLSALREEQGDREGAERALELGFRASPGDASLRDLLIVRYGEREQYSKVAELLELAVQAQPEDRSLVARLVEAHRAAGQPDAALAVIDKLIAGEASPNGLYRTRSALLFDLGRESEAVADLERAYLTDPALAPDLVEALERSIARAEAADEARLTLRLVEVLEAMGDLEGARGRLSEFMRNAPEDLAALRRLASLDARTGHVEDAVTTLAQLVEMESGENLVLAVISLAEACELAGRPGDARFALERALAEDRKNPELRRRLRTVYEAAGANRALADLLIEDSLEERDGARVNLLIKAGELLLGPEGDADQAVRVLETARQENPESIELAAILARAYSSARRNDDALTLLNSITEQNRGKRSKPLGLVYREIARIHFEDGFLTDALQALTKAFELDMKNGHLAMKLGELAAEIDENEIAQRAFRAVTIMKPLVAESNEGATSEMKADANYHLAAIARKLGDSRKAKVLASKALTEKSDHERARQLLSEIEKG